MTYSRFFLSCLRFPLVLLPAVIFDLGRIPAAARYSVSRSEGAIVVTYKQEPVGIFLNVKGFDNFPSETQKLLSSISRCSCSQSSKD